MEFKLNMASLSEEKKLEPLDQEKIYDVLIIGGGPAGLTAAVYCMRKGISTGIIIKDIGGQVAVTAGIENYMGYRHVNGVDLVEKFKEQVSQFGIGYEEGSFVASIIYDNINKVHLEDGRIFSAKALIIATGKSPRMLNVPGEEKLIGKGVAYCAICDAPFYSEKKVVVVGGGNSGIEAAIDLAKVATHVIIVQFLETLTADKVLVDHLEGFGNVDIIYHHEVVEVKGDTGVNSVFIKNIQSNEKRELDVEGIFVEIGLIPNSDIAKNLVDLNELGEIIVDCSCNTSKPGIFAAGDVTSVPFKQIIIAAGEGAKAALSSIDYLIRTNRKG